MFSDPFDSCCASLFSSYGAATVFASGPDRILPDRTGTPEENPDETTAAYTGRDICSYMEAFAALGYKPEQVTKILLTHKHADHSGELKSFPNAKIYVNKDEITAAELQGISNIVPVEFTDGLFYMIHGDITYVDEALYANKLSVVYDDLPAARETLDRVREFIRNHPTVYCGTHTPQGYENLEAKRVMDLDHPAETVLKDLTSQRRTQPEDLPDDWKCPRCKQPKDKFNRA